MGGREGRREGGREEGTLSRNAKGKGKAKAKPDPENEPKGKKATASDQKRAHKVIAKLVSAHEQAQAWRLAADRLGLPASVKAKVEVWLANLEGEKAKLELMGSEDWIGFAKDVFGEALDILDKFKEFAPGIESIINATEAINVA